MQKKLAILAISTIALFNSASFAAEVEQKSPTTQESDKTSTHTTSLPHPVDIIEKQFQFVDNFWDKSFYSQTSIRAKYITEDKQYLIVLEVPGYSKNNITLKVNGNKLFIIGNIEDQKDNKSTSHLEKNFNYSLTLKDDVDQKTISSSLKDGILTIILPRIELKESDAKIIPIN